MVSATSVSVFYIVCGLLFFPLLRPVLDNREKPGTTGMILLIAAAGLFTFAVAANTVATTPWQWYVSANFVLLFATSTVLGLFLFSIEYTGVRAPGRETFILISLFPLLIQLLAWTNSFHNLLYLPRSELVVEPASIVKNSEPGYWIHTGINYMFLSVSILFIIIDMFNSSGIRRTHSVVYLTAFVPPAIANLLTVQTVVPYDLTPFGLLLTVGILIWAQYRADLFDIVPVGRKRAVENMNDPVITVDADGRVVDSNPTARSLVGVDSDWKGMAVDEFFDPFPEQIESFSCEDAVNTEISITRNGRQRHFDLDIAPIHGPQGNSQGKLIVLREISELKEHEQELDLMRQVQSRVLRHNIRNDLQVIKLNDEMLADILEKAGEENGKALAEQNIETADSLLSISDKAQAVEQLVDTEQTPTAVDLSSMVENLVDTYRTEFPDVVFECDCPETCSVRILPAIELALENLLENAAEHNDTDTPRVEVSITNRAAAVSITIADNGTGIPDHELSVLEQGEETPLQHGSGIGLWIVQWTINNSTASIEYETDTDGTEITIQIPTSATNS